MIKIYMDKIDRDEDSEFRRWLDEIIEDKVRKVLEERSAREDEAHRKWREAAIAYAEYRKILDDGE